MSVTLKMVKKGGGRERERVRERERERERKTEGDRGAEQIEKLALSLPRIQYYNV